MHTFTHIHMQKYNHTYIQYTHIHYHTCDKFSADCFYTSHYMTLCRCMYVCMNNAVITSGLTVFITLVQHLLLECVLVKRSPLSIIH